MKYPRAVSLVLTPLVALAFLGLVRGQQVHRNGFEAQEPTWVKGTADVPFREIAHDVTETTSHSGQRSEHIQILAEQGNHIHYSYPIGRAPITEELSASVWVKANRPGVQLLARLVLPKERNPNNLDEPLTTVLRGDAYQQASRWQRLDLRRPQKLAKEQQQLLRAELMRDVDFTDAYIDRFVLNVYSGPGLTEVWIDDLEAGPVQESAPFQTASRPVNRSTTPGPLASPRPPRPAGVVEFKDQLLVGGKRFFIRGIRHTDTPLQILREAGFNTVWLDSTTTPERIAEVVDLGFWVVPSLPVNADDPRLASADSLTREVGRFLDRDAVLFWDLGGGLAQEQAALVTKTKQWLHAADPQRPLGADVWDGFQAYSRSLDVLGLHRWPLMTGLELTQYRDWLNQRRLLAPPRTFFWTWVQTHLPEWYTRLVYERSASAGFDEPIGPQPEQIRLLTYIALAAGCRGIAFWSDRFLADSHQGRDRLLSVALLNLELRMLEPLLVTAGDPQWIDTSISEVKAAVLRTGAGVLVLPMWLGHGSQHVPGQSAAASLTLLVPQVPVGTQAWEITPAGTRALKSERVAGGTRITVSEFGLTAAILFTGDLGPDGAIVRFQDQARQNRRLAAQWARDLAEAEIDKVARVEALLGSNGHTVPDGQKLLENARGRLQQSQEHFMAGSYREAFEEASRALRPLRILMRAQWDEAVRGLDTPVASPYAVSYFTLPRHWQFIELPLRGVAGYNALPAGDFEASPNRLVDAWCQQVAILDEVEPIARRVTDEPHEGRQCLMLQITPKNPSATPLALERTFLAINSPVVRLQPGAVVRVSAWVRVPKAITASADGALFYDSAGGEPLAVRLTQPTPWKKITLYRQVPASGEMHVTLALTGLGSVFFDDVRIEPVIASGSGSIQGPSGVSQR